MATPTKGQSKAPDRSPSGRVRPATVAQVRDFTGVAADFRVEWDVRPAFDFLFSLSPDAGSTDDLPADDRAWLDAARKGLDGKDSSPAAAMIREALGVHLGGFLVEHPEAATSAQVVDAVRAGGPVAVLRWAFGDLLASTPGFGPIVDRALAGDSQAAAEVTARAGSDKHGQRLDLLAGPGLVFDQTVALLERWQPRFAEIEPRVRAILSRDYELRASDRASLGGSDLIERTTGGVRVVPDATVRRVILAPSYFSRPYNYLLGGEGWRFAGYPVADAALDLDPLSPPASVLRLHRALGDATRLRILKLLAEKDRYGTEIAGILDLSKPTITHHLAQLRIAGLVTIVEAGAVTYYHLRRERLEQATGDLKSFLAR